MNPFEQKCQKLLNNIFDLQILVQYILFNEKMYCTRANLTVEIIQSLISECINAGYIDYLIGLIQIESALTNNGPLSAGEIACELFNVDKYSLVKIVKL